MIPLGVLGSAHVPAAGGIVPTYRGSVFKTSPGSATKTYTAAPIGAPSANRTVIVLATAWSPGARGLVSCTIGGVAATQDHVTSGSYRHFNAFRSIVPTGTTVDIECTFSDATPETSLHVWTTDVAVSKVSSTTVDAANGSTSGSITPPSTSAGGFVLAAFSMRSVARTTDWTNLNERFDTGAAQPSSGGDAATTATPATITATWSAAINNDACRIGCVAYA